MENPKDPMLTKDFVKVIEQFLERYHDMKNGRYVGDFDTEQKAVLEILIEPFKECRHGYEHFKKAFSQAENGLEITRKARDIEQANLFNTIKELQEKVIAVEQILYMYRQTAENLDTAWENS